MQLEKYSFGIGDRFGNEGKAQLKAIMAMQEYGIEVVPVWNKSYREHSIIGTTPQDVLLEATNAVESLNWSNNFYVDADHVTLHQIDLFLPYSNFFTIDVASSIGKPSNIALISNFVKRYSSYIGKHIIDQNIQVIDEDYLKCFANIYLTAIHEIKKVYDYLVEKKGANSFILEVSMDECENSQSAIDLFFILAELKHLNVEIQTIAPKYPGIFAKGIDYIGNIFAFEKEFAVDVAIIQLAKDLLKLPSSLKLSVHSGSDKFSLYPIIKSIIQANNQGIHIKTAGTTWLEEIIGLADCGGEGLEMVKYIYFQAVERFEELISPYRSVLQIDKSKLPNVRQIKHSTKDQLVEALTHDPVNRNYNPHMRQLYHVAYKIAAENRQMFQLLLDAHRATIEQKVTCNLLERHLKPLFL